ncbi:C-_U-editing enzyme APOBEC-2b [Danio rerio]|uniref:mRNA(cytosine(6666)) deaminase n=1 Tax=Danio rerio TaxID=7955 RepID=D2D565_DANRE|nr:C->U-editing enzyme APOBEC-2b [Danio rerio]ACS66878.1 apolipoprotein B-editing catalytic subunit 2b [Danio rerio]|eukprot:NP_001161935.1 apolipoprotein B mRNA editing enzyme, catalytic polypeptide-like 2b [Danio rerio]
MADKKDSKTPSKGGFIKKKEKKVEKVESKPEKEKEKSKNKDEKTTKKPEKTPENQPKNEEMPQGNGEIPEEAKGPVKNEEFELEPMELPPFEIIVGDRMNPTFFKFQFKNVEYSSGRNKTFLCYQVDIQGGAAETDGVRGYLEDEHSGSHAEEAFFQQVLAYYDKSLRYTVTWYTSSSPCVACAAKLVEILKARKALRLNIHCSRLFEWEEPEIQAGLQALVRAGCKLRMMRPVDFVYVWSTFVENEEDNFTPWEDCQDNFEYYDERLQDILK